jgi:uncharacterized protein
MEASQAGPAGPAPRREADIAPAPEAAARAGGWSPANPAPLGLAAFATTTIVLSIYNANLVSAGGTLVVLPIALAYGGIAQLLAGMWEFRTGNTFGAVLFSSFGGFWISVFFLFQFGVHAILPKDFHNAFSVFLYAWAIVSLIMFVASLRTSAQAAVTLALLTITFILLAIGQAKLSGTASLTNSTIKLGGWFGIATAIGAFYGALAGVVNSTWGRTLVPIFPLKR